MIAKSMHDAVKGELTACALLSRQNPTFLIEKLMGWSRQTADSLSTAKKFITSFGSLRIEKEARLTFAEMKRTATQILTSNCLETCLDCLERGKDNDDLVFTILSFSLELVNEIAPSTLRRDACIEPLRQIFRAIGRASMTAFVGFMQAKIEVISKSVGYELFIRSLFLVELSIYPSEDLDTSLNLVEILASYYSDSTGFGIREAYAQSLSRMLRPLVQHVSAEVNMPKWDKIFCKILLSRVTVLCEKQKYRQITLDLAVTVLCLCTKELFLEKWFGLCEAIAIMIKVYPFFKSLDNVTVGWLPPRVFHCFNPKITMGLLQSLLGSICYQNVENIKDPLNLFPSSIAKACCIISAVSKDMLRFRNHLVPHSTIKLAKGHHSASVRWLGEL